MIKNIIKQLWNRRKANGWIVTELVLVSVFLWILIFKLLNTYDQFTRPMGFDIEDTYRLVLDCSKEGATDYVVPQNAETGTIDDLLTVFERVRLVPGVEALASMSCAMPYSPCNSAAMFTAKTGKDTLTCSGLHRIVTPDYFKVFRILTPEGRIAGQDIKPIMMVLSKDLADSLRVQRGDSVLNGISNSSHPRIVDLCTKVRYAEAWEDRPNGYLVLNEQGMIRNWGIYPDQICLRLKGDLSEAQRQQVWKEVEKACRVNNFSFFYTTPFKDIRKDYNTRITDYVKMNLWYAVFLLVNILLGIIGTFWFSTQHRRGEIGLRMALGATRKNVFGHLVLEGLILQGAAMCVTILLCLNLYVFNTIFVADRFLPEYLLSGLLTWILVALMIVLGIWYPANEAAGTNPVDALRYE